MVPWVGRSRDRALEAKYGRRVFSARPQNRDFAFLRPAEAPRCQAERFGISLLLLCVEALLLSHRFAVKLETMRVVYESVADRIRQRLVADEGMPVLRLELTRHDR